MLVSDCFRQHLKSLYLNEYPCESKSIRIAKSNVDHEHPMYEIERLLHLIRDKKSPWHETVGLQWTRNGETIRENFIKDSDKIDLSNIEKYFTSLRLNELEIVSIDENVKNFINLNELILTCNQIEDCDSSNLPNKLKLLDLTGNYLSDLKNLKKKSLLNLEHLGLAYNWIENIHNCFEFNNWLSLTSIDLSFNQFTDLIQLTQSLLGLKKLKILMLYGNPVVLLPGYRGFVINSFDENDIKLFALDDRAVNREERINCQDFKLYADSINREALIQIEFKHIKNLNAREQTEIDELAPEAIISKYLIKILTIEDTKSNDEKDFTNHKLHSMNYKNQVWKKNQTYKLKYLETEELDPSEVANLNEKGQLDLKIKSLRQLRDYILDGTEIEFVERKKIYRTKDVKPTESAMSNNKKDGKPGAPATAVAKPDAKQEAAKKKAEKNAKGKKKTLAESLDSFALDRTEEKCLARFNLELNSLLDGQSKIVSKEFSAKIKLDSDNMADKSLACIKEQEKAKNNKAGGGGGGKKSANIVQRTDDENLPVEIDIKFQLIDFNNLNELKKTFSLK